MTYRATPIDGEMIDIAEVRQHIRTIPDTAEDAMIIAPMISAAREYAENITGRAFVRQRVTCYPDEGSAEIMLPRTPVIAIEEIRIHHPEGEDDVLTEADYQLDRIEGLLIMNRGAENPRKLHPIEITYTAGCDMMPYPVREAILLLIGHWYEHRAAVETGAVTTIEIEMTTRAILNQYKAWWM